MKTFFASALLGALSYAVDTDRYTVCSDEGCFYGCSPGVTSCQPMACLGDSWDTCQDIPMTTFYEGPDYFDWSQLQSQSSPMGDGGAEVAAWFDSLFGKAKESIQATCDELPKIEWTEVSEEEINAWVQGKEDQQAEI